MNYYAIIRQADHHCYSNDLLYIYDNKEDADNKRQVLNTNTNGFYHVETFILGERLDNLLYKNYTCGTCPSI